MFVLNVATFTENKTFVYKMKPSYKIEYEEGKRTHYVLVRTKSHDYRLVLTKNLKLTRHQIEEVSHLWVKLNVVDSQKAKVRTKIFVKAQDMCAFVQKHLDGFKMPVVYSRATDKPFPPHWKERLKSKWAAYNKRCIETNRTFSLTHKQFEFLLYSSCTYCGQFGIPTIDRRDSSLGYTWENSQSCCYTCNTMKRNYSDKVFKELVSKIAQHCNLV